MTLTSLASTSGPSLMGSTPTMPTMAMAQISSGIAARETVKHAHNDLFEPTAAVKAGDQTQRNAADHANYDREHANLQRRPRSPQDTAEDVAAGLVGAEPEHRVRCLQLVLEVDGERIVRCEYRREDGG